MSEMRLPGRKSPDDLYVVVEADIDAPMDIVFSVVEDQQLFVELEENVRSVTINSEIRKGLGMKSSWELYHPDTMESWFVDEEIVYYDSPRRYAYDGASPDGKNYAGIHNLTDLGGNRTHLKFEEYFYFSISEKEITEVVSGMVANVKKASESRSKSK
jgi:hypothetical protein